MKNSSKIYFPSLNGIRAIAAILVVWYHIEQIKSSNSVFNISSFPFIHKLGATGVTLFFVLSGFLITYLLYTEQKVTKNISILQFYMRRILRIWPLYFLIIVLSLLYDIYINNWTYIHGFFSVKILLFVAFLPNVYTILFSASGFPTQLWSVGSEEQFYLIWPHLIKRKIIKSLKSIVLLIVVISFLRFSLKMLDDEYSLVYGGVDLYNLGWRFLYFFRVDCMAVGAIAAFLYFNKIEFNKVLNFLYAKPIQLINLFLLVLILYVEPFLGIFQDTVLAVLFAVIIINVATNKKSILNFEFPVFNFLGKISYGMYIYHPLILIILVKFLKQQNLVNSISSNIILYTSVILFTVIVSYLSFKYFEKPFLNLKKKHSKIISGNDVK